MPRGSKLSETATVTACTKIRTKNFHGIQQRTFVIADAFIGVNFFTTFVKARDSMKNIFDGVKLERVGFEESANAFGDVAGCG